MIKYKILAGSVIIFLFMFIFSCCNIANKNNAVSSDTIVLSENIFWETYGCYCGGVWGGDVTYAYLTDSISFRKYIGKYDDHTLIFPRMSSDSIVSTFLVTNKGTFNHKLDTILLNKYNINDLIKEKSNDVPCRHTSLFDFE